MGMGRACFGSSFSVSWGLYHGPLCFGQYERTLIRERYLNTKKGYIKVDGVSSVFRFIWGWEEPAWGLPFQFHGAFYVMISLKGP